MTKIRTIDTTIEIFKKLRNLTVQIVEANRNIKEIKDYLLSNTNQKEVIESNDENESFYSNLNESDISISEYFQKRSTKIPISQRNESADTIVNGANALKRSEAISEILPDNIFYNLSFSSKETFDNNLMRNDEPHDGDGDWLSRYDILD